MSAAEKRRASRGSPFTERRCVCAAGTTRARSPDSQRPSSSITAAMIDRLSARGCGGCRRARALLWKFICAFDVLLLLLLPDALMAQSAAPDTPDAAAGAEIAAATTEPRFLSPWVSYLPASADGSLAARVLASNPRRPRRTGRHGRRLRLQPGTRRGVAARARVHHRALRRGPRHRAARHRR